MAPRFRYGFWRVRSRHAYSRCPDAARPGRRGFGRGHPHRRGGLLAPLPTAGLPLPLCIAPFQSRLVRGLRTARRVPPCDREALCRVGVRFGGAPDLRWSRRAPRRRRMRERAAKPRPNGVAASRRDAAKPKRAGRRSRIPAGFCRHGRRRGDPGDVPGSKRADSPHRQIPPATAWRPIWRTSGGHGSCPTHHIPTKFQRQNVLGRFLPYSGSLYVHTSY